MYDYERRTAMPAPHTFAEAIDRALRAYGTKTGHERKLAEARRIAQDLDREVQDYQGVSADDSWAHDTTKAKQLWGELRRLFEYLFGLKPPPLASFMSA